MFIGYEECQRELLANANAAGKTAHERWLTRFDLKEAVIPFVQGFKHEKLFTFAMSDYERVVKESGHALGNVQSGEQIKGIEDYNTPFALQHLFHDLIETKGILPTWEQYSTWMKTEAKSRYLGPLMAHFGYRELDTAGRLRLGRAIQWRLGKFYYSAMREIELMLKVKEVHGVQMRYHLLADVLLRVDFWHGKTLICVWFSNPKYRTQDAGRKVAAKTYFDDGSDDINIINVEIERQGYGNFWRASNDSIQRLGEAILSFAP